MKLLRVLNARGLEVFSQFLNSDGSGELPLHLLDDDEFSEPFDVGVRVPLEHFTTKMSLAQALDGAIDDSARQRLAHNIGVWSWLALLYLHQLAPKNKGVRHFGDEKLDRGPVTHVSIPRITSK